MVSDQALSRRGSRYFVNDMYRYSPRLWQFLFSDLMADVCRATLGDSAVLFHEQWVVKGAEQGMNFSWHQDSGYVKSYDPDTSHQPYVTCWCTLDDVTEANGTVYLLPHSRAGTRGNIITHTQDPDSNDLIGYSGEDPGIAVEVPAGSNRGVFPASICIAAAPIPPTKCGGSTCRNTRQRPSTTPRPASG